MYSLLKSLLGTVLRVSQKWINIWNPSLSHSLRSFTADLHVAMESSRGVKRRMKKVIFLKRKIESYIFPRIFRIRIDGKKKYREKDH